MFVAPAAVATPEAVETLITRWGGAPPPALKMPLSAIPFKAMRTADAAYARPRQRQRQLFVCHAGAHEALGRRGTEPDCRT